MPRDADEERHVHERVRESRDLWGEHIDITSLWSLPHMYSIALTVTRLMIAPTLVSRA